MGTICRLARSPLRKKSGSLALWKKFGRSLAATGFPLMKNWTSSPYSMWWMNSGHQSSIATHTTWESLPFYTLRTIRWTIRLSASASSGPPKTSRLTSLSTGTFCSTFQKSNSAAPGCFRCLTFQPIISSSKIRRSRISIATSTKLGHSW